jgi:hypothetical protein
VSLIASDYIVFFVGLMVSFEFFDNFFDTLVSYNLVYNYLLGHEFYRLEPGIEDADYYPKINYPHEPDNAFAD